MQQQRGLVGRDRVRPGSGRRSLKDGAAILSLQGGTHSPVNRVEHLAFALEFHLGFRGVNVYVHRVELGGQVQHAAGKFAHHALVGIGLLQRGGHQAGLHIPSVDEKMLIAPGAPAADRHGREAGNRNLLRAALHGGKAQSQLPAQHAVKRRPQLPVAGGIKLLLAVAEKLHGNLRAGKSQPLDHRQRRRALGRVPLNKFQPGGGVEKQIPHHDGGALGAACFLPAEHPPPLQRQRDPQRLARLPGEQGDAAHGGYGGQGLAPEAQGADGL
ncbi:hypothetical protein SDC9_136887 [bioreactor metagenome]|uniref:Uncharacterized protein n=1 Tax=bioreactor metagenome TaxID=1076179 RepID=A0A645DKH9_9ZZZZ